MCFPDFCFSNRKACDLCSPENLSGDHRKHRGECENSGFSPALQMDQFHLKISPKNEKADQRSGRRRIFKMVGAAGIEPATFCSQSRRAEPLRYAPKNDNYIKYSLAVNDSKAQNNLLQFFINDRPPRKQTATRCNGKIPPDASATENYSSVTSSFFT